LKKLCEKTDPAGGNAQDMPGAGGGGATFVYQVVSSSDVVIVCQVYVNNFPINRFHLKEDHWLK